MILTSFPSYAIMKHPICQQRRIMLEESAMSIAVLLVYIVFMGFVWLISMIPAVIHGIGLARICKKMGAFKPVWCWVWAVPSSSYCWWYPCSSS